MSDFKSAITDFQRQAFSWVLLFWAGLAWVSYLLNDAYGEIVSLEIMLLLTAAESACIAAYWLRDIQFGLARLVMVGSLWLCNIAAIYHIQTPLFLYTFGPLVLLTYNLSNMFSAFGVALASSWVLVAYTDSPLSPLIALWIASVTGFITLGTMQRALKIATDYQQYAVKQMDKARTQRAELARLTHALRMTQERIVYANAQLLHARNLAEESRQIKARFAANVSHELRTPINLIVGFSEILAVTPEAYGQALPSVFRADVHAIYRNAQYLQKLINDILDISQLEAGRMSILKKPADLAKVIQDTVELVRDQIESKGLAFLVNISDDLPVLPLDSTRISQVILNLLSNAVRFSEHGEISLRAELDDALVRISVSDTGVGISKTDLEHVFEEFYQIKDEGLSDNSGTGLGLTLSRDFVRLHGGDMTATSDGIPGRGSTFAFTIPVPSIPQRSGVKARPSQPLRGKDCIVVVDEDPAVLQLFKGYITQHNVMTFREMDEAVECIQDIEPASVVVAQTADTNGLIETVRHASPHSALISCPMPSGHRLMQMFGVDDYLVKPISRQVLLDAIGKLPSPIEKILIIDDNLDVCRMFSQMLLTSSNAYQIATAHTGKDGLAMMRQNPPDAVILDIVMPDLDGFAVIQQMKKDSALAEIPIMLASAYGASEAIASNTKGEITIYKPAGFKPTELINCIDAVVAELIASAGQ